MIDIAIGVLKRGKQVCLALRQREQTLAGTWEFPGGKVEDQENFIDAVTRECMEELGVKTSQWQPLIIIPWHYEHEAIKLHVYVTEQFEGEPDGLQGQQVQWVEITSLSDMTLPDANHGIVTALQLDDKYMVSGVFADTEDALSRLAKAFDSGVNLCQLRAKNMAVDEFTALADKAIKLAHNAGSKLLLNGDAALLAALPGADGIQLSSSAVFNYQSRPISKSKLLAASAHNEAEIAQALKIDADFILLSPVKETNSHPGMAGLGWKAFHDMVHDVPVPVYALGGMKLSDIEMAKKMGAQGVATISDLWPSN